ncbi:MAG: RraA family protein [Deltaproteobacteria bacterium]|nr:RraA family protein [Deltaproteobacteria bacterium]
MFSPEVIEGFLKVATASIADAVDKVAGRRGYMDHEIKPRISDRKIAGPAVTILEGPTEEFLPPQHALDAIDECAEGSVIVIGIGAERDVAVWGGLMTAGAEVRGLAGAVLDGGVRDVTEIRRDSQFQVFARSVSPATTLGRYKTLSRNETVRCGGVLVRPGDLVVGDLDGVVVVPKEHVEAVLRMATEIELREAEQARLIRETGSLREGLAKYGRI